MKTDSSHLRYLWFNRGGVRFAAAMDHLQEVLPLAGLRPLPASEPSLAGLIVLRQSILPIFDPASMIHASPVPLKPSANAVVLSVQGRPVFAVIAEEVGKVVLLPSLARISTSVRLSAAFAGETQSPGQERVFVLNVLQFATTMGLFELGPALPNLVPQAFSLTTQIPS